MGPPTDLTGQPITVVLADDHGMVRAGLRLLLEAEADLHVVAEARDADEALAQVGEHEPDVLVLDLNMPGRPPVEAIGDLLEAMTGGAVVVMTMEDDPAFARAALAAGASAYVLKEGADAELVTAIRAAAGGRTYVDPELGARLAAPPPPAAPPAAEPAVGDTFADHRIDALIARGGMAVVFRATDLALDRTVALKLMRPGIAQDAGSRARFERECRMAAAVDHPRVVPIYRAGAQEDRLYLTMRFIDGTDLRRLVVDQGALEAWRAVDIAAQVADALDAAHRHRLVHRDVKPGNVLLASAGARDTAYLTDFGVGRLTDAQAGTMTSPGAALGTADYMAPEQAEGAEVDARADVYSLACVLFEALSGNVPYERDTQLETLYAHVHQPPPELLSLRPDLPPALGSVIRRAMAKRPDDRYESAGAFAGAALRSLGG